MRWRLFRRTGIFTNVATNEDGRVWWEGMDGPVPRPSDRLAGQALDARLSGPRPPIRTRASPRLLPRTRCLALTGRTPRGSRFRQFSSAVGVPRLYRWCSVRSTGSTVCYLGATMASETTAAATGAVGVVRRDPMAMLPFCGYNMADYWEHWLAKVSEPRSPGVFQVNWFRKDADGRFIWPGFGENMRVLRWIYDAYAANPGDTAARRRRNCANRRGAWRSELGLTAVRQRRLLSVDRDEWLPRGGRPGEVSRAVRRPTAWRDREEHRRAQGPGPGRANASAVASPGSSNPISARAEAAQAV